MLIVALLNLPEPTASAGTPRSLVSFVEQWTVEAGSELHWPPSAVVLATYLVKPHYDYLPEATSRLGFGLTGGLVARSSESRSYATADVFMTYGNIEPGVWLRFDGGVTALVHGFGSSEDWQLAPMAALGLGYSKLFLRLRAVISSNAAVVDGRAYALMFGWVWDS
ncbi:MAG: hypothetical protein H7Z43_07975 [Clostridia bacterium]|nr:hypothetical protein [Deltaproteobacteria bacterium]